MYIFRIIAAAIFVTHVLMGCGWHHYGDVTAECHGKTSCQSTKLCGSSTDSHTSKHHSSQPAGCCEVEQCVYLSAPHVDLVVDWNVVPLTIVVDNDYDAPGVVGFEVAGEQYRPHVRRHVALNYFLN